MDNELANKKYVDDTVVESNILRFNQLLENYLKVAVGNDTYNLTRYDKIQITFTKKIKAPNNGGYFLQNWKIKCSAKNGNGKISKFINSTKISSPTGDSGATSLPPIGDSFMYIETSSNNEGENTFCSFELTDIIQNSNLTFYYNRFSILTNDSLKSMGRLRIQFLLKDDTWSTRYNLAKNDRYSDSSTDWTLVNLYFTVGNYGIRLNHDQIDTAHSDMSFSNIALTHFV